MNTVIDRLTAPGRLDAVEKVLKTDPFFVERMGRQHAVRRNRRGIQKSYDTLTISVVNNLALEGMDAARMRRAEIIAKAFQFCELTNKAA
jgi:hypothetical protein